MTPKKVYELIDLYEQGWGLLELTQRYNVSPSTVSRIITGKTWVAITGGCNRSRSGKVTENRAVHIAARLDQGCRSLSTIADELGISRQAVSKLIKSRNLMPDAHRACA